MKLSRLLIFGVIVALALVAVHFYMEDRNHRTSAPPCSYGNIEVQNTSRHPYLLYIDNKQIGQLSGGKTYTEWSVAKGFHKIYVEQVSGHVFAPKKRTYEITLGGCETKVVTFP